MDRFCSIDALFDAMNLNSLYGQPESPKPDPRRAFVRSKSSSARSSLHDIYGPRSPLPNMWDGSYYGSGPFGPNRVEELDDFAMPRSMSADGLHYRDTHPVRTSAPSYAGQRLPFEQAAASMYAALVCANQECRNIDKTFGDEVHILSRWLPTSYVDSLWRIRIEWDGRPVNGTTAAGSLKVNSGSICYESIVKRFATAMTGMRNSAPPDHTSFAENARLHLSWEVINSTMRKMQIALEAIEELMHLVRTRRDRMPLLLHEIADAMRLLETVREVWETPASKGGSKGKARDLPPERRFNFDWPEHGGETAI